MDIFKFTILAAMLAFPMLMLNIANSYSKISADSIFAEVQADQSNAVIELAKADTMDGSEITVASK